MSQSIGSKRVEAAHPGSYSYQYGINALGQTVGMVYEEDGKDKVYKGVVTEFIRGLECDFSDDDDDGEDLYLIEFEDGEAIHLKTDELVEGYRLMAENPM